MSGWCWKNLPGGSNNSSNPEKFDKEWVGAKAVGGKQPEETKVSLTKVQPKHNQVTVGVGGDDELGEEEGEESGNGQQDTDAPHLQLISALCAQHTHTHSQVCFSPLHYPVSTEEDKHSWEKQRPNQMSRNWICKEFTLMESICWLVRFK